MFLLKLFNINSKCNHNGVSHTLDRGYCPDCGKLIKNDWYITRCACCGLKLKTMVKHDKIQPQYNYCSNCGSSEYIIEKLPKINFIDINFAVLIKSELETIKKASTIQCWQEKTFEQPKLLVQYR